MVYCENCGFENSDNATICVYCIRKLKSDEKVEKKSFRSVNPELEIRKIKKTLEKDDKSISWRHKKCPICKNGLIKRKRNTQGLMKHYRCNICEAFFTQIDAINFTLTEVPNEYPEWKEYKNISLTKRDWIKIAYDINKEDMNALLEKNNLIIEKNYNTQSTVVIQKESMNYIEISFYESMPGRLSFGNNKSYIKGILELGENEIIIHKKSLWRGRDRGKKHIRYDNITSVDYDAGKLLAAPSIQIYLSSIEYSFRSYDPRLSLFYNRIREKMAKPVMQVEQSIAHLSPMDELKKLAELKEMGIVSEEEFELKKKQLLDL